LGVAEGAAERHAAAERWPGRELEVEDAGAGVARHHRRAVDPAGAQRRVAAEVEAGELEADGRGARRRVAVKAAGGEDGPDVVGEAHALRRVGVVGDAALAERRADLGADGLEAAGEEEEREPPHGLSCLIAQLTNFPVDIKERTTSGFGAPAVKRSVAARRSDLVWSWNVSIESTSAGTVTATSSQRGDQAASPGAAAKMSFVSSASPSPSMSTWRAGSDSGSPPARVSS